MTWESSWGDLHLHEAIRRLAGQAAAFTVFILALCLQFWSVTIFLEQIGFLAWRRHAVIGRMCDAFLRRKNWKSNLQQHPNAPIPAERQRSWRHDGANTRGTVETRKSRPRFMQKQINDLCNWFFRLCINNLSRGADSLASVHRIRFHCGCPGQKTMWSKIGVVLMTLPTIALALHEILAIEKGIGGEKQHFRSSAAQGCVTWTVLILWPVYVAACHRVIDVAQHRSEEVATEEETEGLVVQRQGQEHQQLRQLSQQHCAPIADSARASVQGRVIGAGLQLEGELAKGVCLQPTIDQVANNMLDAGIPADFEVWRNDQLWCRTCRVWRPPYTYHCNTCGVCVEGRDHHCGILGVCIGDDNRAPFILVCMLAIVACAADVVMLWPWVLAKLGHVSSPSAEMLGTRFVVGVGFPVAGNVTGARVP